MEFSESTGFTTHGIAGIKSKRTEEPLVKFCPGGTGIPPSIKMALVVALLMAKVVFSDDEPINGIFMVSKGDLILLEYCRGRYELFYSLDYFYEGGFPIGYFTDPCFHSSNYCEFFYILIFLIFSVP